MKSRSLNKVCNMKSINNLDKVCKSTVIKFEVDHM